MKTNVLKTLIITFLISGSSYADLGSFEASNTSFKNLFNNYRTAEPDAIPWAGSYWAYARDGIAHHNIKGQQDDPPAKRYGRFFDIGDKAYEWEKANHSCEAHKGTDMYEGCKGWWGHCNAWAAAAIKEAEPRKAFTSVSPSGKEMEFTIADQKGLLTEMWMNSGSLFSGNTHKGVLTGNWVYDKNSEDANKRTRSGETAYQAFWDVTPKSLFYIFTNYVGIRKTGLVIDRFTGDQVWNQPIVGYRILPIRPQDKLAPEQRNGRTLYPVHIRMKIYWAEDGVHEYEISDEFSITKTDDNERAEKFGHHFTGRLLQYRLFFDKPLNVNASNGSIDNAGRIIGDGVWYHQTNEGRRFVRSLDETHPDFIWLPTSASRGGNANPYVQPNAISYIWNKKVGGSGGGSNVPKPQLITNESQVSIKLDKISENFPIVKYYNEEFSDYIKTYIGRQFKAVFDRAGISIELFAKQMIIEGDTATFDVRFIDSVHLRKIKSLLIESGYKSTVSVQ